MTTSERFSAYAKGEELFDAYKQGQRDFRGIDLEGVILAHVDLSGVNLSGVNLSGAKLSGVNLTGANLSGANLRGAKLYGTNLTDADLTDVDCEGTPLTATLQAEDPKRRVLYEEVAAYAKENNVLFNVALVQVTRANWPPPRRA